MHMYVYIHIYIYIICRYYIHKLVSVYIFIGGIYKYYVPIHLVVFNGKCDVRIIIIKKSNYINIQFRSLKLSGSITLGYLTSILSVSLKEKQGLETWTKRYVAHENKTVDMSYLVILL